MANNFPKLALPNLISEDMKTMSATWRHCLVLSHAVPAARVRPLVPNHFALDTLKVDGETCAIVQTLCYLNQNFHYTPLPKPSLDFWQATYRVLTRAPLREDTASGAAGPGQVMVRHDPGAYIVHSFLGTRSAWAIQKAVASGAEYADFNIINRGDTYEQLIVDIVPQSMPPTQIAVRSTMDGQVAAPFIDWGRMVRFLSHRPNNYYLMTALTGGENIGVLTLQHADMLPMAAELVAVGGEMREAKLGVWQKLGILTAQTMLHPFAVFIQPQLQVTAMPPKLLRDAPLAPTRQGWAGSSSP